MMRRLFAITKPWRLALRYVGNLLKETLLCCTRIALTAWRDDRSRLAHLRLGCIPPDVFAARA